MNLYFIALLPPQKLSDEVRQIKEEIRKKYRAKHALKLPAHITLQPPFPLKDIEEEDLIRSLRKFAENQSKFEVNLNGFGAFPPRVIFIDISNPKPVKALYKELNRIMKQFVPEEDQSKRELHPHMTLATRDLYRKNFKDAWEDFQKREFSATFLATKLCLFKHNGKTWDVYREFRFKKNLNKNVII